MKILAIETSCDETSAAVLDGKKVLCSIVASQIKIHEKTGGVVPEVASRAHTEKILPVIEEALEKADTLIENIDLIAVTTGPGLIGSLLVGVETAKTLAYAYKKPIIGINHLEGHIFANFIGLNSKLKNQNVKLNTIKLPAICLTVSGGHTSLILMRDLYNFKIIGETRDDAAGEAFDKVAKILDLGYPGGPAIEACASKFDPNCQLLIANRHSITFPRPMLDQDDFSFSGLKTSVLYEVMKHRQSMVNQSTINGQSIDNRWSTDGLSSDYRTLIAYEFQKAIVETLVKKTIKAAGKHGVKSILLSGGVAANKTLRSEFRKKIKQFNNLTNQQINFFVPPFEYCTDNAAMIGMAAYIKSKNLSAGSPQEISGQAGSGQAKNAPIESGRQIKADANLSLQ